jgi:UDP-GlcNAc:undecaprenyl-phosphate GlcNAc-1-phosphate transferase
MLLLIMVVGTFDDRVNLGITPRLVSEIGVAVAVWAAGQGWQLGSSEAVDLIVTVAWVVGLINAYNLMDNLDGATPTLAVISAVGVGVVAAVQGDPMLAAICFALAGACIGFLPHNLARPSKMFLGDGGSMPIGFTLAVAVMMVPQDPSGLPALAVGVLLVSVPLLDMAAVIVSRRRRGVEIFVGGRDHMTHRLFRFLNSERLVAVTLAWSQGLLCLVAVVLSQCTASFSIVGLSILVLSVAAVGSATIDPIGSWWKPPASPDD